MAKFLKIFLLSLGGMMAFALIVGGVLYYLLTRPVAPPTQSTAPTAAPTPAPPGVAATVAPPPQVVEQQAQSLENKLSTLQQQISQAQQGATPQPFRLEITEDEANAMVLRGLPQINQQMKGSSLAISSVQAAFRDGKVKAVAQGEISGFKASVNMEATVTVEAGKPKLAVQKVDLGLLPLPAAIKDQIAGLVQDMFRQVVQVNPSVEVQKVTIADGKLVMEGVIAPAGK